MGIAERREREKEALRTSIVEAARDIVSEKGLDALSMRSIAERIEYSPGTIYLYFKDKNELVGEVIRVGFERMGEYIEAELTAAGPGASSAEQHRALGRAYAKFGLENTAYFRVMFELPTSPHADCAALGVHHGADRVKRDRVEHLVSRAMEEGLYKQGDARTTTLIAWALIHGLTSLYLSGHLLHAVHSHETFLDLVETAMDSLGTGMQPRETGTEENA